MGCRWTASAWNLQRRRLVLREVLEARSNYKRSYLWWLRNLAYGDSTGSDGIEKDWVGVFLVLVLRKWREGMVTWCDLMCVWSTFLWANGGCVIMSVVSSYMVSVVLVLFGNSYYTASGKWNVTGVTLQEFVTGYILF